MNTWQSKLVRVKAPSPYIVLMDVFFILLVIFMMSSNFVFLPGVKSVPLPVLPDAEIVEARKLIVTVSQREDDSGTGGRYIYSFNGQAKKSREDLESAIREVLDISKNAAVSRGPQSGITPPIIVLRAEKSLSVEELINFYSFARKLNTQLFLATDFEKKEEDTRMRQPPEQ